MSNLLKKASIITTPTAYDDGRILSVKPNENLYGSELVVNGDLGTVGSITTSSYSLGYVLGGSSDLGVSIVNNALVLDKPSGTNTDYARVYLTNGTNTSFFPANSDGKKFKLQFEIKSKSGQIFFKYFNNGYVTLGDLDVGIHTIDFIKEGSSIFVFKNDSSTNSSVTIDNISVVEDLSGDFTFSRNSAATRVNAQGLVENVQILSPELVSNGNFSQIGAEEVLNGNFSQEGSELVTNGDFENGSTGWAIAGSNLSIANGKATSTGSNFGAQFKQTILTANKFYKLTFDIVDYTSGSIGLTANYYGEQNVFNSIGTHTAYFTSLNQTELRLYSENFIGSIDNVSVKEVGQGWELSNGSISDKYNASMTAYQSGIKITPFVKTGNYKVVFDLVVTSGSCKFDAGNGEDEIYTTSGTKEIFITNPIKFEFNAFNLGWVGSLDNVSVKEVGQDWGFTSIEFIGANTFKNTATNGKLEQSYTSIVGAKYRLSFVINSGSWNVVASTVNNTAGIIEQTGTTSNSGTIEFIATTTTTYILLYNIGASGTEASITNVSVVEVTDDTDLPRINYEGFSYQDVLGSELVVNGDFAVDSNWIKDTGWTISGGLLNCNNSLSNNTRQLISSYSTSKRYIITYTVSNYVSGGVKVNLGYTNGAVRSANGTYTEERTFADGGAFNGYLRIFSDGASEVSIDNVSLKEYLGQEVVPNSGCGSWLFEPQSTNLVTYSEDFSQSYWSKLQSTVASGFISPDGKNNAFKLVESSNNDSHILYKNNITTGSGKITLSIKAKAGERKWILFGDFEQSNRVYFDLENGVVGTVLGSPNSYSITALQNGWYDITLTTTATTKIDFQVYLAIGNNQEIYQGDGTSGVYIWGAQLEQLSYATSYIPTDGAASTRLQDIANNSGNSDLINSTEGVLYAEISALANDVTNRYITLSDGTSNNRLIMRYANGGNNLLNVQSRVGGVIQANLSETLSDITVSSKVAFKYKENDFALWVNGFEVGTDTSGSVSSANTLNKLNFSDAGGGVPFYGKNKALAVWKEALTDTELELLTAPAPEFPTFSLDFDTIAEQFTFTRGSEATFVNEQGLIQSTNELGAELVTNGDFATDSDWNFVGDGSISNGELILPCCIFNNRVSQSIGMNSSKSYKLQINITEITSGDTIDFLQGGAWTAFGTQLGINTVYITNPSDADLFLRNNNGTSSIKIDNVSVKEHITATNTPRIDYSTGVEAFLLEPQSTNLITYSEDISNAYWTKLGSSTTSGFTSPSGIGNAYKLVEDTSNGLHWMYSGGITVTNATTYNVSVFAKKGERNSIRIAEKSGISVIVNLESKDFDTISAGVINSNITELVDDWVRIDYSFQTTSTSEEVYIYAADNGNISYQGNGSSGIYVWGVQLEQKSYPTSYIPTDGATATRNQETCIDATPTINSEEGVLYAEINLIYNQSGRYITLGDGTSSNRIIIGAEGGANRIIFYVIVGGSVQCQIPYILSDITAFYKIAIKYKQNDFALWVNGLEVGTDTSGSTLASNTLSQLVFNNGVGTSNFYGNTKELQVFDKALSDYQLKQLTTI